MALIGIGVDVLTLDSSGKPRIVWGGLKAIATKRETVHPRPTARDKGIGLIFGPNKKRG